MVCSILHDIILSLLLATLKATNILSFYNLWSLRQIHLEIKMMKPKNQTIYAFNLYTDLGFTVTLCGDVP